MKRLIQPLTPLLGLAALVLLQQGCAVNFEVVSTPSDPYPNATHIEHRVKTQVYRVTSAFNAGNLGQDMADGLAENDEMVRSMAYQDREPSQQTQDLDPNQTAYLDSLLNDNSLAIDDAVQRHQQWAQAFQGNWSYDYNSPGDRMLYIAYLQHQVKQQQAAIAASVQSGTLTQDQSQELTNRTQIIMNVEINDYRQNNRMDLNAGQIQELRQMADDNNRYINYRTHHPMGDWSGDKYNRWDDQHQRYANSRPQPNPGPANPVTAHSNPNPPVTAVRPTPVPASVPTVAPAPVRVASPPSTTAPPSNSPLPNHPASGPTTTVSKPAPIQYLPLDSLTARTKNQDQRLQALHKNRDADKNQVAALTQKRNAYNQVLNQYLKQNPKRGLTQDQMNQLSKKLDDLDKAFSAAAPEKNK